MVTANNSILLILMGLKMFVFTNKHCFDVLISTCFTQLLKVTYQT